MKIGIDVSLLFYPQVAGMRLYLERLLDHLLSHESAAEYILTYASRHSLNRGQLLEKYHRPNVRVVPAPVTGRLIPDSAWWFGYHPPLQWLLHEPVDVFHAGEFCFPRTRTTPLVGTIYDLTPELLPHLHQWPNRVRHRCQMAWLATHSTRAIAISASTAADFRQLYGQHPPIDVLYPGVAAHSDQPAHANCARSDHTVRRRLGLGDFPFVLCVGTVEPRKNGERLLKAFEMLLRESVPPALDYHLVFAGRDGWHSAALHNAVLRSPVRHRVHFTGEVSEEELAALYKAATVFAYPSLYEGFGLPVLEAMQAGVPVLTASTSSLPEVAGSAAVLVDPHCVDAIRVGLRRLLGDNALRQRLSEQGRAHASQFSWRRMAEQILKVYERAIADHSARAQKQAQA